MGIENIKVIADDSIESGTNLVAGANKPETHLKNVNYPRDFKTDVVTDITLTKAGDKCPKCGLELSSSRGIEVGHTFKPGAFYSVKQNAYFIDRNGESRVILMGCYGIGLGRLMAAVVEQNHDAKGIIWPLAIAPYQVYLCPLYSEDSRVADTAEGLYTRLIADGYEVLFDDRNESPGVKFNDADLLGIPIRITVSPRTLEKDSVEVKQRSEKESHLVLLEEIIDRLKEMVNGG